MYRRRRLVVVLMAVALVLTAKALAGGAQAGPAASPDRRVAPAMSGADTPRTYVVKQGDTLWSIARQLQPGGDVRPVVDRLAARHRGAPLRVGERIDLP